MLCLLYLLYLMSFVHTQTIVQELRAPSNDELTFMKKFGYLPEDSGDEEFAYTAHSIGDAVAKIQAFAGLPQTGVIDDETKKLFKRRRCGRKDIESLSMRRKRNIKQQQVWKKQIITYRVLNNPITISKSRVEELIDQCVKMWAPHSGLRFYKKDSAPVDIEISFERGDHGDGSAFDGRGQVIAHAFPPPIGNIHFDVDELWADNPDIDEVDDFTDFFAAAVHEMGHALGLSHSNISSSVMYPYYQVPIEKLHSDDILAVRELYFRDKQDVTPAPRVPDSPVSGSSNGDSDEYEESETAPDLCQANYDTIQVIHGRLFVFEEDWVWVLNDMKSIEPGYPRKLHDIFIGLPDYVDTVKSIYQKENKNIVLFHDDYFYEFNPSFHLLGRGNIMTTYNLPMSGITTAFISNYNNKTYLISFDRFWRYNERTGSMDHGYPKHMTAWRDIPYPVDAALIWKGDTYFFRGPRFWRFDNKMVKAHEYYPQPTAVIWFPCENYQEALLYTSNDGL